MAEVISCMDLKKDILKLEKAAKVIRSGGLVIFPTETVYGIGANGLDPNAVEKIFLAKGRKSDNPLILHVSSIDMVEEIAYISTPLEKKIMAKFWPGPLTIVLKKKENVPNIVCANLDTVGVRMPSNEIARALIKYSGVPIAAPSANISGRPSGTNIEDIREEFDGKVDYFIDGGATQVGIESTVIRVIDNTIYILRPGKITKEDLLEITDDVVIDKNVLNKPIEGPVLSPGVKYRHYAPKTPCILIYSKDENKCVERIIEESKKYSSYIILATEVHLRNFDNAISMGNTLDEISHNIFTILRSVDKLNVDIILIEGVSSEGIGLAIMNRLLRACSYNYIEI